MQPRSLQEHLLASIEPNSKGFPDTITYNGAISACAKGGRWDKALELFHHLQTHGPARNVFPDTITYSAAISACEKGGRQDLYIRCCSMASTEWRASPGPRSSGVARLRSRLGPSGLARGRLFCVMAMSLARSPY